MLFKSNTIQIGIQLNFQYSMLFENIRVLLLGGSVLIETSPKVLLYVISDNILRGKYSLNFME